MARAAVLRWAPTKHEKGMKIIEKVCPERAHRLA
jgi:hypothetical protein